jgi:myo-inositol-1-phosphate synthase
MVKLAISSQLSLEKVVIRLQRISEFKDVLTNLNPVMSILKETENRISDFVPEVASGIEDVNSVLNELSTEAAVPSVRNIEEVAANQEAKKVLEESNILAEQRIKEQFPDIPDFPTFSKESNKPEPVALTTDGEALPLHERVYDYLKERKGDLSITECASWLEITPEDVKRAIDYLKKEGKVIIE